MGLAEHLSQGFPQPRSGKTYEGWPVTRLLHLVYEPRLPTFWVYLAGIHKLQPRSNQVLATHYFSDDQRLKIRAAVSDICEKLVDHGLRPPRWAGASRFVLLGDHVRDRDYVLLEIADRIKESLPYLEVECRFAGNSCINNCCR